MIIDRGVKTYSNAEALGGLAKLARAVPNDQAIVEVGVFRGGSLRVMAESTGVTMFGVDAWGLPGLYEGGSAESGRKYRDDDMRVAQRAVAGLAHVILIRDYSQNAADVYDGPPVGLLYIDAEHTYDAVRADFNAWWRHLSAGAAVAFDDYTDTFPDVRRGIDELVIEHEMTPVVVYGGRLATTSIP